MELEKPFKTIPSHLIYSQAEHACLSCAPRTGLVGCLSVKPPPSPLCQLLKEGQCLTHVMSSRASHTRILPMERFHRLRSKLRLEPSKRLHTSFVYNLGPPGSHSRALSTLPHPSRSKSQQTFLLSNGKSVHWNFINKKHHCPYSSAFLLAHVPSLHFHNSYFILPTNYHLVHKT